MPKLLNRLNYQKRTPMQQYITKDEYRKQKSS